MRGVHKVGLHIRISGLLVTLIEKSVRLNLPHFQSFLASSFSQPLNPTEKEITDFVRLKRHYNIDFYVHGSYWINFARDTNNGYKVFKKEVRLAKRLEAERIIIHPGAAIESKEKGIHILARTINAIIKEEPGIKIVLENTAHSHLSIGSDLNDFKVLLENIDHPELIAFCIDTAHAHSFGYDLKDTETFVDVLNKTIGLERIVLIHLNNTREKKGSCIDQHSLLFDGLISPISLCNFINHPLLATTPIVLELPITEEKVEKEIVEKVTNWYPC